jgi:hypothetical protein
MELVREIRFDSAKSLVRMGELVVECRTQLQTRGVIIKLVESSQFGKAGRQDPKTDDSWLRSLLRALEIEIVEKDGLEVRHHGFQVAFGRSRKLSGNLLQRSYVGKRNENSAFDTSRGRFDEPVAL